MDILIITFDVTYSWITNVKYRMRATMCATLIKDKRGAHHYRSIVARSTREEGKVYISICGGNEFPRVIIQPSKRREIF